MTKEETQCLRTLRHIETITIHKADKNNITVVQNKKDYANEGERQLNDGIHYIEIPEINIKNTMNKINEIVYNMNKDNYLDEITFKYIKYENQYITTPFAYFLPKIHKLDNEILKDIYKQQTEIKIQVPARPIISQCNGPLERIGRYLDFFLLPIVKTQTTYISDTGSFIRLLEKSKIETDTLLVTYDITSLYTNLRFSEIIAALNSVTGIYENLEYNIIKPSFDYLLQITNLILLNNEFTFNKKCYRQIIGASQGHVASPQISDIAIYQHINKILNIFPHKNKILFHKRMKDDGYILFQGTTEEVKLLFEIANTNHNLLQFTYEIDRQSLKFLDLETYKGQRFQKENILDIKCFTKPTEKFQYLHQNSNHAKSCFKSFIKGEGIRILRNTSDPDNFNERINLFTEKLIQRGYKIAFVNKILRNISHTERLNKLTNKETSINKNTDNYNISFITQYHANAENLQTIIRKHWHLIQDNPQFKNLFDKKPTIAFKRNRNIGEIVKKHLK